MSRTARIHSQSGCYHIMLRGINRQQIFFDEEDNCFFINLLRKYKEVCGFRLYAYSLMGNHVHMLLQVQQEPLEKIIKRITDAFVYWYNSKYERSGHLFQGRFKSEPIDNERYFLTVLRYILRNPVEAGLCVSPDEYRYGSGKEYFCDKTDITDKTYVLQMISLEAFKEYVLQKNDDSCLEMTVVRRFRCSDEAAKKLILREFGTLYPSVGNTKERDSLNKSIRSLVFAGISIRQLSRLSGISKKIIENGLRGDRGLSPVS